MRMGWRVTLLGLSAVSLACGGDDSSGPNRTLAFAPANSGEQQTGTALVALADSLRVRVTDNDGNPVEDATVTWATDVVGGSVSPVTSVTDANGIASTRWIVGAVNGNQITSARVSNASGSPLFFHASVSGGSGARFGNTFFRSNRNNTTDPAVDTITSGTTFKWWGTGGSHTVHAIGGGFASGQLDGVDTFSVNFPSPGTFQYDCAIHTSAMTGTIVVQ